MNAVKRLLEELRQERWCFTEYELARPEVLKACRGEDEFIAGAHEPDGESVELGVIVYRNGQVSNRWEDGTAGVPDDMRAGAADDESPVKPLSSSHRPEGRRPDEDDLLADKWRDVEVDEDGSFQIVGA